jgi:hypothetical protein
MQPSSVSMHSRRWPGRRLAAIALIIVAGLAVAGYRTDRVDLPILGERPGYGPASVSPVPNLAAIDRLIWVPDLDDGWDPQGLTVAARNLFVSAYRSRQLGESRGPCRMFRIDAATGRLLDHIDIPAPCGHAGGLAYAGGATLYLADTHTLFQYDWTAPVPKFRVIPLGRGVRGAFAASGRGDVWLGTYERGRSGRILQFRTVVLDALADAAPLDADMAVRELPIPSYAQGAAVDSSGKLWISRSGIAWGWLDRLDPRTGAVEKRYPTAGGIEGIAFDEAGRLWGVSETGVRHIPLRYPFFPLIFRIDPARLVPDG